MKELIIDTWHCIWGYNPEMLYLMENTNWNTSDDDRRDRNRQDYEIWW